MSWNFATSNKHQQNGAKVVIPDVYIYTLDMFSSERMCRWYIHIAWVFYFACSLMLGNAKASRRGTSKEFGTTLFLYIPVPNMVSAGTNNDRRMKTCINCGTKLEDSALFCGECGTKQPDLIKKCSHCSAEIPSGAKFCTECGTPTQAHSQDDSKLQLQLSEKETKKVNNLRDRGGLIKYSEDEAEKLEKLYPFVAGEEYQEHCEYEKELLSKVAELEENGELEWEQFGQYARDVKSYGKPKEGIKSYKGGIEYAIYEDILVLKGSGMMPRIPSPEEMRSTDDNYWELNSDIEDSKDDIVNVVILGDIKSIGPRCFRSFRDLTTVVLPDSIETIRTEAFCDCGSLEYITLPKNLREIKRGAFEYTGLACVFIPYNLESCEAEAFRNSDLSIAFIPDDCELDDSAFEDCENLEK